MERTGLVLLAAAIAGGCLETGGGLDSDDEADADGDVIGGDSDADADTDGGADADTDGDADDPTDLPPACPAYPAGPYGLRQGYTVENFSLAGGDADGVWSMEDFWCMGQTEGKTVLILNIHSPS
jgi:hypothetical protein